MKVKLQKGIVLTIEELIVLLEKSFDAGSAYTIGSHKDFKQIHPNKEEFIKSIIEDESK